MPSNLAPIIVFCYNRPWHLQRTLEALQQNPLAAQSSLVVFSDGPKREQDQGLVAEVRSLLSKLSGFGSIRIEASAVNKGLARSVIEGVSQVLQTSRRVIVLEDDMLSTPDFLDYMNSALDTYEARQDIFSVTGYTPPFAMPAHYREDVYLAPRASSWGWGTWKDCWQKADWQVQNFEFLKKDAQQQENLNQGGNDLWPMLVKQQRGVIDSWAIRWTLAQAQHNAYGLYPVRSKIQNIGTDGSGTNFTFKTGAYGQELTEGATHLDPALQPDSQVVEAFQKYYQVPWKVTIKNFIKYGI